MDYEKKVPEWHAEGTEPPESLKQSGFEAGYKPPAAYFNWFWNRVSACLTEIRSKLSGHAANKENPHGVTAAQVGLDKVNNTSDAEKNVAFASESASSRKVENSLVLRFNGGGVENTNLFTYNGSGGKSVNITPDKINAAEKDLSNIENDVFKGKAYDSGVGIPIAAATSADGVAYTATVDGVTELYNGLIITIVPDINSASTTPTLDVNGIGAKMVRLPLSFNNAAMTTPRLDTYISAGRPLTLQYDAAYLNNDGIWKVFGKQRTSAQDLYGTVPIEGGGTNATDGLAAIKNLGGLPVLDACGSANDLNEIGKTGEFAWYKVDGSTINSPKFVGLTGASLGYVLNIPSGSSASSGQYAAQLAIYRGGTYAIFYRHASGGACLEGWGKIIPNPKLSYKTLWSGSATDGTRITFNENIWNYQYIVGSLEYTETNVMLLSKNLSQYKCLMQAGLLGGDGGVVTRICNLEIAADGLSATVNKCARMTHSANGNHTAETAIALTHVIGLTVA